VAPSDLKQQVRIVVAGHHAHVRAGIRGLLTREPDFIIVGEAATAAEAVRITLDLKPDLLLLDVAIPSASGVKALRALSTVSDLHVLLLTASIDTAEVLQALELGAKGVLLKDSAAALLMKSIRTVNKGEYWIGREIVGELIQRIVRRPAAPRQRAEPGAFRLTPREREIVAAVAEGCGNRDIASQFGISGETVKHHLTNIFDKTGTGTRLELALFALDRGLALLQ
jgi:DNA-binding NarL/FixJ family response regulator